MELDEMKLAWRALDRRLDQQHALSLQLFGDGKLDKTRRVLRPLKFGQWVQLILALLLSLLAGSFWFDHRDSLHLLIVGLLVHAYGMMLIVFAVRNVYLIGRLDCAAPVLTIQRRGVCDPGVCRAPSAQPSGQNPLAG